MTGLKDMIRAVQGDLPVTMRHERWMTENPDPVYNERALGFAAQQLAGTVGGKRKRQRLFRASAGGQCQRRQLFRRVGIPEQKERDSKTHSIFATGSFLHLKWQMAGLTEGWLVEAEVIADRPELGFGGTMDGILYDGSGFEFKSINSRGYAYVMEHGPKPDHLTQTDLYMILSPSIPKFSIVYENKDDGEWREFVHHRDVDRIAWVQAEMNELNGYLGSKSLPQILPDCQIKEGYQYRYCPFRDFCLRTTSWPV